MEAKVAKIAVTGEADKALERMIGLVNEGFKGGRVGKQELASWVILYFERKSLRDCMDSVRTEHFDQVAYLSSVIKDLRSSKKAGREAVNIEAMLAPLVAKVRSTPRPKPSRTGEGAPTSNVPPTTRTPKVT